MSFTVRSLFALVAISSAAPAQAAELRRLALLVANHDGGPGTTTLRYARADAEKLGAVLVELGGFAASDLQYVIDDDADGARAALAEIERRVADARALGAETTLLVYYSGHARGGALRLGQTQWPMRELREALTRSQADVRIGIIDACQSGAITRSKGGRPGPSFLFSPDDGQASRGLVLISSSSDDEDSQESDQLGGSYFTHYLSSGLRGDADTSGDQRVTLAEMYGYAYNKTIVGTAETRSGVQHPTYSYDLEGSGHLVLTDVSRGQSGVYFGAELSGDFLIIDRQRDHVAAEVRKAAGQARRIALAPGAYVLEQRLPEHRRVQQFVLSASREHVVDQRQMRSVAFEEHERKGVRDLRDEGWRPGVALRAAYQSFLSPSARSELFPPVFLLGAAVQVSPLRHTTLALEVSVGTRGGADLRFDALSLSYDFLEVVIAMEFLGQLELGDALGLDGLALLGGLRLAGVYLRRAFPEAPSLLVQDHFTLSPLAVGGLGYGFDRGRHVRLEAVARLGFLPFSVDDNRALVYLEGGLQLGVSW